MDIETTKPSVSRINNYLLGGNHNFEIDSIAADQFTQLAAILPRWMRLNRLFVYFAVEQLVAAGLNHYIGLARGIPTQGYLHTRLPET
jgi:hypothetical protein